jgi:hypothetical protein
VAPVLLCPASRAGRRAFLTRRHRSKAHGAFIHPLHRRAPGDTREPSFRYVHVRSVPSGLCRIVLGPVIGSCSGSDRARGSGRGVGHVHVELPRTAALCGRHLGRRRHRPGDRPGGVPAWTDVGLRRHRRLGVGRLFGRFPARTRGDDRDTRRRSGPADARTEANRILGRVLARRRLPGGAQQRGLAVNQRLRDGALHEPDARRGNLHRSPRERPHLRRTERHLLAPRHGLLQGLARHAEAD